MAEYKIAATLAPAALLAQFNVADFPARIIKSSDELILIEIEQNTLVFKYNVLELMQFKHEDAKIEGPAVGSIDLIPVNGTNYDLVIGFVFDGVIYSTGHRISSMCYTVLRYASALKMKLDDEFQLLQKKVMHAQGEEYPRIATNAEFVDSCICAGSNKIPLRAPRNHVLSMLNIDYNDGKSTQFAIGERGNGGRCLYATAYGFTAELCKLDYMTIGIVYCWIRSMAEQQNIGI